MFPKFLFGYSYFFQVLIQNIAFLAFIQCLVQNDLNKTPKLCIVLNNFTDKKHAKIRVFCDPHFRL